MFDYAVKYGQALYHNAAIVTICITIFLFVSNLVLDYRRSGKCCLSGCGSTFSAVIFA